MPNRYYLSKGPVLVPLFWYQFRMAMVLSFFSTNHLAIVKNKTHLVGSNWYLWESTSHKLYQPRFVTFSKIYLKNSPPQSTTFVPPAKHLCYRESHVYLSHHLGPGYLPNLTSFTVSLSFLLQPYWPPIHFSAKQIPTTELFTSFVTEPHGLLSLSSFRFLLIDYLFRKAAFKCRIEIATLPSPLDPVLFTVQILSTALYGYCNLQ